MAMEVERGISTLVRRSSYFDRICDELVAEILNRLPIKPVHRCKSVCKRWSGLISTHHFIKSYVIRRKKNSNEIPSFSLFYQNTYYPELRHRPPDDNTISLFYATDLMLFQSTGFSLTPPPSSSMPFFTVLSSSNGLVLCSESLISHTRYHICNPLTKCWVSTPPPPTMSLKQTHIGFLCKASMDFDTINNSCGGFVIVRIPNHSQYRTSFLKIEIYDSESGQWAESELNDGWRRDFERHHHAFYRNRLTAVVCKRLFHWRGFDRVFIYDPSSYDNNSNSYENQNRCKIVKMPLLEGPPNTVDDCYIGECKGQLMYTRFQHRIFTVWKLKDDYDINEGGGEECWSLLHSVLLNQMVFDHPNLMQFFEGPQIDFMFLAFHPFDENVVFICNEYVVQSCNMLEKTVTTISHVLSAGEDIRDSMPYLVVLPWWPVPLSLGL